MDKKQVETEFSFECYAVFRIVYSMASTTTRQMGKHHTNTLQCRRGGRRFKRSHHKESPTDDKAWQRSQSADAMHEKQAWMDQPSCTPHWVGNTQSIDPMPLQTIHPSGKTCPQHCPDQSPTSQIRTSSTLGLPTVPITPRNNTPHHGMQTQNKIEVERVCERSNDQCRQASTGLDRHGGGAVGRMVSMDRCGDSTKRKRTHARNTRHHKKSSKHWVGPSHPRKSHEKVVCPKTLNTFGSLHWPQYSSHKQPMDLELTWRPLEIVVHCEGSQKQDSTRKHIDRTNTETTDWHGTKD